MLPAIVSMAPALFSLIDNLFTSDKERDEAKLKLAEQTAEVSRHRNRLHDLEHGEDGRRAEMRQLKSRVTSLERELAEATAREEALRQSLAAAEAKLLKVKKKKGYEPAARKPEPEPAPADTDDAELRLRQRIDKLSKLAKQPEPDLSDRLAEAERQTRDLEKELTELDAKWTESRDADARGSV
jgi:chromosome segregation ATPase